MWKLIVHYFNYEVSGNILEIKVFYKKILLLTFECINKQKINYNLTKFYEFLKFNTLLMPNIYQFDIYSSVKATAFLKKRFL